MSSKLSKFRKDAKCYIVVAILISSSLLLFSVFYRIFRCEIPSLPVPPSEPIAPTPSPCDYIINRTVIFENCTMVFNNSLFIEKGGALILRNTTLYFRAQGDDLREIIVYAGGNLTIIDSWIAGYAYRRSYYIVVYKGAKFLMRNSTISYAGGEGVWIGTDNVIISGSKFQFCNGLFIENAENVTLYDNIFSDNEYGVQVFNVSNIMIFNNTINRTSHEGIVVAGSENVFLANNTINNYFSYGILLDDNVNVTLVDNSLLHCGLYITGFNSSSFDIFVHGNTVNNKPLLCLFNKSDLVINDKSIGQLIIIFSKNIRIVGAEISDTTAGIIVSRSESIVIEDCKVTYNYFEGIFLFRSSNICLSGNDISMNRDGIFIERSENVTIRGNVIRKNIGSGIEIQDSKKLGIANNTISECYNGVFARGSSTIMIVNNTVSNNHYAFYFQFCSGRVVEGNILINNTHNEIVSESEGLGILGSAFLIIVVSVSFATASLLYLYTKSKESLE